MSSVPSSSKQHAHHDEDAHFCQCANCRPKHDRTIVLAFDGTGDQFDDENTNVVKLCAVLDMQNPQQLVYYQPGIGTYTPPGVRGSIQNKIAKFVDTCFGWYLDQHVMDGYEYLMNHHKPGDKICIFGFSRGAYTARALAGMLHHVGLLAQGNHEQVPAAWRLYKNKDRLGEKFKRTFCKEVIIDMLGVWDTVGSVGYLTPRTLPFVSNRSVRVFRHAISIDERRKRFGVELWDLEDDDKDDDDAHTHMNNYPESVQEVWFAGCHCDVGGGNYKDEEVDAHKLANISLRWMLNEIHTHSTVIFKDELLDYWNIPTDCVTRPSAIRPSKDKDSKVIVNGSASISKSKAGMTTSQRKFATEDTVVSYRDYHDEECDDNPRIQSCIKKHPPRHRKQIASWADQDRGDYENAAVKDEMNLKQAWWYIAQLFAWSGKAIDKWGYRKFPQDPHWIYSKVHYSVWNRIEKRKDYTPRAVYLKDALNNRDKFIVQRPLI
ncbi:hypothetical protein CPB86DRAFT_769670 [Serendipita vermifera]|nr:hypothetical protein CPB86DRAFT_769670 [Serendipita vermifera]